MTELLDGVDSLCQGKFRTEVVHDPFTVIVPGHGFLDFFWDASPLDSGMVGETCGDKGGVRGLTGDGDFLDRGGEAVEFATLGRTVEIVIQIVLEFMSGTVQEVSGKLDGLNVGHTEAVLLGGRSFV